jgi:hypothetical protein
MLQFLILKHNAKAARPAYTMPTALKLDHQKPITYESALKKDTNVISQAAYLEAATELY